MRLKKPILEVNRDTDCVIMRHESMRDAAMSLGKKRGSTSRIFKACRDGNIYYGSKWKYEMKYEPKCEVDRSYVSNSQSRKSVLKLDMTTGRIIECFDSITAAARSVERSVTQISHCCHGEISHVLGFKWSFVPEIVITPC